jgi:hypothetical protein
VSTLNVSAGFFERPSDVVWLPRSWTLTRLKRRSDSALDAGSLRLVQPQDGGSGAVSVRGLDVSSAHPRQYDGDHRATRPS